MPDTRQHRGVRYHKAKNRDSRWGVGKVHWMVYDRENKLWRKQCRPGDFGYNTTPVAYDTPVTCKRCEP